MNNKHNLLSRENRYAIALFIIIVELLLFTADTSPSWIYQGF